MISRKVQVDIDFESVDLFMMLIVDHLDGFLVDIQPTRKEAPLDHFYDFFFVNGNYGLHSSASLGQVARRVLRLHLHASPELLAKSVFDQGFHFVVGEFGRWLGWLDLLAVVSSRGYLVVGNGHAKPIIQFGSDQDSVRERLPGYLIELERVFLTELGLDVVSGSHTDASLTRGQTRIREPSASL
jgi:hypothetical protein